MPHLATLVLTAALLAAPPDTGNPTSGKAPQPPDALQSIEATRGGRHWVDQETAAPKSPEASRECFQLEPGLRIELVAAEPLVMDPVAIAFDAQGQMYVAEYGDYPTGPEQPGPPLSRVVMLEDTDGDGRLDRRHVFADGLNFCHSLMAFDGGLLVAAQTEIIHLRDTDGDHRADQRTVLFQGFTPAHPQMQIGNPRWGIDNWIYLNYGPGKISSRAAPDQPVEMPRLDFRFHPRTLQFEADSGLGQFGNTVDNWGHRFYCTNRNPIIMSVLPPRLARRNPYAVIPRTYTDVGPSGGDTRVYPLVQMKSNYLSHAGTHTSACGTTVYRDTLLGPDHENNVFVCEPVGHVVTRSVLRPDGVVLNADRGREKADFLASSDTWFRPASLATGPDGGLYLADMYRLWVEHPKFLPEEIAKRLDWRAGEDRGRIWRIVREGAELRPFTPPRSTEDLVALLGDPNGWRRHLGQRLLVEGQRTEAVPGLGRMLSDGDSAYARFHALWTLDGLGQLSDAHLRRALADPEPHVRQSALRLLTDRLAEQPQWLDAVLAAADDPDVRVRFQVALALGESDRDEATRALADLAARDGADFWFGTGVLTAARMRGGRLLEHLVRQWAAPGHPTSLPGESVSGTAASRESADPAAELPPNVAAGRVRLIRELATVVGTRGELDELAAVMNLLAAPAPAAKSQPPGRPDSPSADPPAGQNPASTASGETRIGAWWQTATLAGLATGLSRHRGGLGRTSLAGLLAEPPPALRAAAVPLRQLLQQTQQVALNRRLPLADRLAAIDLLGYQPLEQTDSAFDELLSARQPAAVQQAAIDTLRTAAGSRPAELVLAHWSSLGPSSRGPALDLLLRRADSTLLALEGMADGKISSAVLDVDQRVRLLRHSDSRIQSLAMQLFGGAISANRLQVAEQYKEALTRPASAGDGARVFQRVCAKCHRVDGQGHAVGPDISDVRNRARDALLYDILDPNRKIEPRFTDYTVITDDGRILNGLMDSETAETIVLLQPEGKQLIIPRDQIEEIRASGKSLMPEGVEKEITVQQMADLLEFLKSRRVAAQ